MPQIFFNDFSKYWNSATYKYYDVIKFSFTAIFRFFFQAVKLFTRSHTDQFCTLIRQEEEVYKYQY